MLSYMYMSEGVSEVVQLCLTLCDPVNCSLPGSFLHGILQARLLEWVAISFSTICIYMYICVCVCVYICIYICVY